MTRKGKIPESGSEPDRLLFNRIYRTYLPALVPYARRFVEESEADDVVQDVFIRVWSLERFRLPEKELKPYLYRSVLNGCRDRIKHRRIENDFTAKALARLKLEEIDWHDHNPGAQPDDDRLELLHRYIGTLPEKCRAIFRESYFSHKKSKEIAGEMGISQRTVEAQLYKALKILRGLFS